MCFVLCLYCLLLFVGYLRWCFWLLLVVVACLQSCLFLYRLMSLLFCACFIVCILFFCVCYVCPFLVLCVVVCLFYSLFGLFAILSVSDVCAFVLRVSCVCVLVRCF